MLTSPSSSTINSKHSNIMITTTSTANNIYLKGQQDHHQYRPLPSVLTDFFAFKLCDLIPTRPLPVGSKRTAPELVYFILKITSQARISCHIAVVALIYIERCKAALPKNAIGDQGIHSVHVHDVMMARLLIAYSYRHYSPYICGLVTCGIKIFTWHMLGLQPECSYR
ncbi:hypothetical protein PS15p_210646 [Mucor circinelloides]